MRPRSAHDAPFGAAERRTARSRSFRTGSALLKRLRLAGRVDRRQPRNGLFWLTPGVWLVLLLSRNWRYQTVWGLSV
jgi:hypothetical protein